MLGAITLYYWALWVWERAIECCATWPVGLYRATKAAVQISVTKKKERFVAGHLAKVIVLAEIESPDFRRDLEECLVEWRKQLKDGDTP